MSRSSYLNNLNLLSPQPAMQTTQTVHQARWDEIVRDPALRDLPYKVETNERGQLVLSPHSNLHSRQQGRVVKLLSARRDGGNIYPEFALATSSGVKVADVIWVSREREQEMMETGDPTTLAPEICIEVMSPRNSKAEMQERRALYREIGAEEVWIVEDDGTVRFYAEEELDASSLVPEFPRKLPGHASGKV